MIKLLEMSYKYEVFDFFFKMELGFVLNVNILWIFLIYLEVKFIFDGLRWFMCILLK